MKKNIFIIVAMLFVASLANAQDKEKTQKEKDIDQSLQNIKKELEKIKNNVDSAKLREIAKTLEKSADEIASELEDIADEIEEKAEKLEEKYGSKDSKPSVSKDDKDDDGEKENQGDIYNKDKNKDQKDKSPFDFKNKKPKVERRTKTYFEIQTGLNGLAGSSHASTVAAEEPQVSTWSWYFDYALKWKTRVGGTKSPVSINYGLSYLKNSYSFENDVRIVLDNKGTGSFKKLDNTARDPKLVTGHVTIPVGLDFKVGKKGGFGVGAYGGYRIVARQILEYKDGSEKVEEVRRSNYGLNDIVYGVSANVKLGGFKVIGRYNLSPTFENFDAPKHYNSYMIGLSWAF